MQKLSHIITIGYQTIPNTFTGFHQDGNGQIESEKESVCSFTGIQDDEQLAKKEKSKGTRATVLF